MTLSKTAMISSNIAKLTLCIGKLRLSLKAKVHEDTLKDINKNKTMKSKALTRITSSQDAFQSSVDWQTVEIFIAITERKDYSV